MRSGLRIGISLFALALAARLIYLFVVPPPFQDFYWDLAGELLRDGSLSVHGVKTTEFEPMYPLFLALARWLARDQVIAVQAMQALVASLGAVFLFRLGEALAGRRVGVVSGVLYACYPLLIRHSSDAVEAALLTTILIALAYAFVVAKTPLGAGAAGLLLGAAVLTRAAVLPLLPLSLAAMLADGRRRAAMGLALAAVIVVAPWVLRNHALNESLLPTRGGRNLFLANCEYAVLPEYGPDILNGFAQSILAREALDRQPPSPALERRQDIVFRRYAFTEMMRRPLHTLWLKVENVWYFFSPRLVPYHEPTPETRIVLGVQGTFRVENSPPRSWFNQWSYALPYALVVIFAAAGWHSRRRQRERDAILWCIALTFVAVHAIYFPTTRYRVPMEFVLLFYAAVGLDVCAKPLLRYWPSTSSQIRDEAADACERTPSKRR